DVNYKKYTYYSEDFDYGEFYNLHSDNQITGAGFDFKLGAIFRPFETSPLRVGVAVHTPTFYNLTQYNNVLLEGKLYFEDTDMIESVVVDSYDYLNNRDNAREFRLHTPWKYNFSLGYIVGNNLALGAEYEFQDYSTIKFRDPDYGSSWFEYENSTTSMLKGVSTLRLGAEYKVIPEFAIRAGYNYSSAIFKSDAYKALPLNSVNTDTDFSNSKSINNFTVGVGYRGRSIYADLAYQYTGYKEDFYAFDELYLNKTDVKNSKSQVLLTLGMRF
ncbi:MAG: TonB-dependent receptor, partial [Bacteroides sp.]|nr:TonB-dependent receptor [Bacteroides sp.]